MPTTSRPIVLVFSGHYLPGYRAGGPIRSISNLVASLGDRFDFRVITSDRDLGSPTPFPDIQPNVWQEIGRAKVLYVPPGLGRSWRLVRLLRQTRYDLLYLNSFFSREFSMLPLWLWAFHLVPQVPLLLAPRGEFFPGALRIRTDRKHAYIRLVRFGRLDQRVFWHASSRYEAEHIGSFFAGHRAQSHHLQPRGAITVAPDLAALPRDDTSPAPQAKTPGSLDVAFIARVSRGKNLDVALEILAHVRGEIRFNIFGPIEDRAYWEECRELIRRLPPNIHAEHRGELPHSEVQPTFRRHHLFLFPTRSENFGHSILEALSAGCPVVTSDQTPWRNLPEFSAGWDLPLDRLDRFRDIVQQCVDWDGPAFERFSRGAATYGHRAGSDPKVLRENLEMFEALLQPNPAVDLPAPSPSAPPAPRAQS